MDIKDLLQLTIDRNASDLHMISGIPPHLRVEGQLSPIPHEEVLTPDVIHKHIKDVLSTEQLERFTVNKEMDFSLSFSDKARFRVNAYTQKGTPSISFRTIPLVIPSIDDLGLPKILHAFASRRRGFLLVACAPGAGMSTTLASVLNEI